MFLQLLSFESCIEKAIEKSYRIFANFFRTFFISGCFFHWVIYCEHCAEVFCILFGKQNFNKRNWSIMTVLNWSRVGVMSDEVTGYKKAIEIKM